MSGRYKVLVGSQSGHCCFDYTVVDTLKPHPVYASQGLFDAITVGLMEYISGWSALEILYWLNEKQAILQNSADPRR